MNIPSTVQSALALSRSALSNLSDTPNLDGQLLLGQVLGRPRSWLLAHPENVLEERYGFQFLGMLDRCLHGEALPHVLGWWEFYGRRFHINASVLIPRPETEHMVDAALEYLKRQSRPQSVVDVGTGSGCVAITLAREIPGLRVLATDLSLEALRIARTNVFTHAADRAVHLVCTDLVSSILPPHGFDLVCANLPYIPEEEMDKLRVSKCEPRVALAGGKDGLQVVRRLLQSLSKKLSKNGRAILEIGSGQADSVLQDIGELLPRHRADVRLDYAGHPRLVVVDR